MLKHAAHVENDRAKDRALGYATGKEIRLIIKPEGRTGRDRDDKHVLNHVRMVSMISNQ